MDSTAKGGNDLLWGDPTYAMSGGADTFVFTGANGKDTVFGFRPDTDGDKLELRDVVADFGDLVFSEAGGNTMIDIGASMGGPAHVNTVLLFNFTGLDSGDVVLVV